MTSPHDGPDVRIRMVDIYALVQEQTKTIQDLTVEVRLANLQAINDREEIVRQDKRASVLEGRVTALERKVWALPSLGVVLAVAGLVLQLLR